jgi:hypothetical protein
MLDTKRIEPTVDSKSVARSPGTRTPLSDRLNGGARVAQLQATASTLNTMVRRRNAPPSTASGVVQRQVFDDEGEVVTVDRVRQERDRNKLRQWRSAADPEEDAELIEAIDQELGREKEAGKLRHALGLKKAYLRSLLNISAPTLDDNSGLLIEQLSKELDAVDVSAADADTKLADLKTRFDQLSGGQSFLSVPEPLKPNHPLVGAFQKVWRTPIDKQAIRGEVAKQDDMSTEELIEAETSKRIKSMTGERAKAIVTIRGPERKDDDGHVIGNRPNNYVRGAIPLEAVEMNRDAINVLVNDLGPSGAVFSLERGGSFVADHIFRALLQRNDSRAESMLNVKIAKPDSGDGEYKRKTHFASLISRVADWEEGQVFKYAHQLTREAGEEALGIIGMPRFTIAITETAVSGSSVNTLLPILNQVLSVSQFVDVRLLVERQTGKEHKLAGEPHVPKTDQDPNIDIKGQLNPEFVDRVRMTIARVHYILGEDVNYQLSYTVPDQMKPLLLLHPAAEQLYAFQLMPGHGVSPREALIDLVAGAFNPQIDVIKQQIAKQQLEPDHL